MTTGAVRVAIAGLSHWHLGLYLEVFRRDGRASVVGLSNGDQEYGRSLGRALGCGYYPGADEMCTRERPDVVLVLGRHSEMPDLAEAVIGRKIPVLLEKPGGTAGPAVAGVKRRADEAAVFASVPLVHRLGPLCDHVAASGEQVSHCSFRFLTGPSSRYPSERSDWMLDPDISGGGCTRNLAVHFIDLFLTMTGLSCADVSVVSAAMSRDRASRGTEDYSVIVLQGGASTCTIETGYLFRPSSGRPTDISFSVRTGGSYLIAGPPARRHHGRDGQQPVVDLEIATLPLYRSFVSDVFDRLESGQGPLADLGALVSAVTIVDEAYEKADWMSS